MDGVIYQNIPKIPSPIIELEVNMSGTSTLLSVTRCKSDTSTLLAMHKENRRRWRSSSRGSASTLPVLSLRNS